MSRAVPATSPLYPRDGEVGDGGEHVGAQSEAPRPVAVPVPVSSMTEAKPDRGDVLPVPPGIAQDVELRGVTKKFGRITAVDNLSLTVRAGEFLTLLGPSGSGKSTVLMLLAGFETPSEGAVFVGGERIDHVPPHRRNLGVVFQHYALFPHMSVFDNLAFPLRARGIDRNTIQRRVAQALARVQLTQLEGRLPRELSGGQQQRVAVARAIVFDPPILLMDEPLSALDKKLREEMQVELKHLQRALGITVISVTHDQGEALTMSDRVALMNGGHIVQSGTPNELYDLPANRFVAEFIGESNLLAVASLRRAGDATFARTAGGLEIQLPKSTIQNFPTSIALRPERLMLRPAGIGTEGSAAQWQRGCIEEIIYLGDARKYRLRVAGETVTAKQAAVPLHADFAVGQTVDVGWLMSDLRVFE